MKKIDNKQEREQLRKYLKAVFKSKFGYIPISLWIFLKKNTKYYLKSIMFLLMAISLVLGGISIYNFIKGKETQAVYEKVNKKNNDLKPKVNKLQQQTQQQNDKLSKYDISNQTGVIRASDVTANVFKGMYEYDDGTEYANNRKKNLELFLDPKAKWIDKLYSDDKDANGESMIDNLKIKSSLNMFSFYTENPNDVEKDELNLIALVEYKSTIPDVSNEFASQTHQAVYSIIYDTKQNKIKEMNKTNTINDINTIN
ncbi:hypothetical protein [Staphylococcus hyicus]|uniref:hypothetical protein n=1 Tax=Staphylococcus hyicus TaxID=1284 RepID=UPI003132A990